jgi:hypothetical protein
MKDTISERIGVVDSMQKVTYLQKKTVKQQVTRELRYGLSLSIIPILWGPCSIRTSWLKSCWLIALFVIKIVKAERIMRARDVRMVRMLVMASVSAI